MLIVRATGLRLQNDESAAVDHLPPLRLLGDGRFIGRGSVPELIHIWFADGRYSHSVGQRGQGPGEFLHVAALYVDAHDTVHVADAPGRWHLLDPQLRYARSMPFVLDEWTDAAFGDDGHLITGRNAGFPPGNLFYIINREGGIVRAFGTARHHSDTRRIAYAGDDRFWAVSPTSYSLELWTMSGERLAVVDRRIPWFPPTGEGSRWTLDSGSPVITRLLMDTEGRLVSVIFAPHADRPPPGAAQRELGDWIVEVFDGRSGALLASRRFDDPETGAPTGLLQANRYYVTTANGDGTYAAVIFEFELRARSARAADD